MALGTLQQIVLGARWSVCAQTLMYMFVIASILNRLRVVDRSSSFVLVKVPLKSVVVAPHGTQIMVDALNARDLIAVVLLQLFLCCGSVEAQGRLKSRKIKNGLFPEFQDC